MTVRCGDDWGLALRLVAPIPHQQPVPLFPTVILIERWSRLRDNAPRSYTEPDNQNFWYCPERLKTNDEPASWRTWAVDRIAYGQTAPLQEQSDPFVAQLALHPVEAHRLPDFELFDGEQAAMDLVAKMKHRGVEGIVESLKSMLCEFPEASRDEIFRDAMAIAARYPDPSQTLEGYKALLKHFVRQAMVHGRTGGISIAMFWDEIYDGIAEQDQLILIGRRDKHRCWAYGLSARSHEPMIVLPAE